MRRHHLLSVALSVTFGIAAAIVLILLVQLRSLAFAGGAVAAGATWLAARRRIAPADNRHWSIDRDGRALVRQADVVVEATVLFSSSFLIVLRHGKQTLEVWRDATPPTAFRRLAVAARWRIARVASDVDPDHAADRT
jgi:hypothetical protein